MAVCSPIRHQDAEWDIDSIRRRSIATNSLRPRSLGFLPTESHIDLYRPLSFDLVDPRFWWRTAGRALALLLHNANYPAEAQYEHLIFFALSVAPQLGPVPGWPHQTASRSPWRSFMTDDHTPIEFSWDWGVIGDSPKIRYSIEPIGQYAGTFADPFNQRATIEFIHSLKQTIPRSSFDFFGHFAREFLVFGAHHNESHESRFFGAFDLETTGAVTAKAYFFPQFRAAVEGKSNLEVLGDAFRGMPGCNFANYSGFNMLQDYVESPAPNASMTVEILAIDCVEPTLSRLKIYTRSRSTSFDSVRSILTLGGRLDSHSDRAGLEELRELWSLLFGYHLSDEDELDDVAHRTGGILYNFEIVGNGCAPVPKIYIPVRHYAASDMHVVDSLQAFLSRRRGTGFSVEGYRRTLCGAFSPRTLQERAGVQTYLACAIKNGSLRLTSYFNPHCAEVAYPTS